MKTPRLMKASRVKTERYHTLLSIMSLDAFRHASGTVWHDTSKSPTLTFLNLIGITYNSVKFVGRFQKSLLTVQCYSENRLGNHHGAPSRVPQSAYKSPCWQMPVQMRRLISFHSTRPVKGFIIVIFCWRKLLQLARVSWCNRRDRVTALCK